MSFWICAAERFRRRGGGEGRRVRGAEGPRVQGFEGDVVRTWEREKVITEGAEGNAAGRALDPLAPRPLLVVTHG